MHNFYSWFSLVLLIAGINSSFAQTDTVSQISQSLIVKDTIYTFANSYIEVNLLTQRAYLHTKDSIFEFKISSGTSKIAKGVETKSGIFVIQSKVEMVKSKQFDDIPLLYWMGFNLGIGFHALHGNSYYSTLGKKPTSHGCLRVSREDIKKVYKVVELGSPVIIHKEDNAIVVNFLDKDKEHLIPDSKELPLLINKRLDSLYAGIYDSTNQKIVISKNNVTTNGIGYGDITKIKPVIHTEEVLEQSAGIKE